MDVLENPQAGIGCGVGWSSIGIARRYPLIGEMGGENGVVLVVDGRVGEDFTPGGNKIEWMMYGWNVLHCLPVENYFFQLYRLFR